MKIRGWSLNGIGLAHDLAVSDLPDGLTVLHGANEAGKSTLLELLRRVLFGLPPNGAAPPRGSPHRGRVVVGDGAEQIVIERELDRRAPPVLRRPDGRAVDAGELHRLLGGADERLFRAVFAFCLDDLQSLGALDAGGVRDTLFSASLAGAGRSARAAAQALRAQAAMRLGGDGAGRINRLIGELNTLRPRLNRARHAALAYGDHRAAADRAAATITARRGVLAARRTERERDDALLRAWPAWQALHTVRAELAALEPIADLPDDVEAELRAASGRLATAEDAARTLRAAQAEAERLAAAFPTPDGLVVMDGEIEALYTDLPLHRFQLATLPGTRARQAEAEHYLAERLQRAGADWSADRLRAWSGAGVDRDRVRDWHARLRAAGECAQQAGWRLETAQAMGAAARRERELAAAEGSVPAPLEPEEIARQRQVLGEVRAAIEEMLTRRRHGEVTAQVLRERQLALQVLEATHEPPPPKWLAPLLGGGAVAAGALALWSIEVGALLSGLGGLLVSAVAGAAVRWATQRQRAHTKRQEQRQAERRTLRSEMETARRARDAEWHHAAQLAERIARQAQALGLSRAPGAAELAERERALGDAEARTALLRARLAELDSALRQREAEEQARAAEVAAATAARESLDVQWAAWAAAAGFADAGAPDIVLERVAVLDAAQGALAAFDTAAREVRQGESMVAAWEARGCAALARAGTPGELQLAGHVLIERILALRLRLQDEAPQRAQRAVVVGEMRERAGRLQAADAEVERCRQQVASALRAAGAHDEADLLRRRRLAERRRSLQHAVAEHERAVRERLDDEQALAVLATGTVDAWRERAAAADEELAALEQHLYQAIAEHQRLRAVCCTLEESAEVASLESEWAALTAELGDAVREWCVLAAAAGLIDEAQHAFERTRQPAVLRAASRAFAAVTGGRYERVAQDDSAEGLVVVEPGGRRKQVGSELSRGTTEQLYLSIRLGLAQEFARRGVALPLMMDDVLVNFDPERARTMAEVLGAFAREQQVLFVTCHPATRDLLVQHGRADRLIEL